MSDTDPYTRQPTPTHVWHGHALEDLKQGSRSLKCFVAELMPGNTTGPFKEGRTTYTVKTKTVTGITEQSKVNTTNYIVAQWKGDTNDYFAPTVRKGEQVTVFQYGDSDVYFWDSAGRDKELRTLENRRHAISATKEKIKDKTDDNTYFTEWNSEKGHVVLAHTSKANKEPVRVTVEIDTKNGRFHIGDDKCTTKESKDHKLPSNTIDIDFVNDVIQLTTHKKAFVRLDKEDIFINAPRDVWLEAGRQFVTNSPLTTINKEKKGMIFIQASSLSIQMAKDMIVDAARLGINAVSKFTKLLAGTVGRFVGITTSPIGTAYKAGTENLQNGSYQEANNKTDTKETECELVHMDHLKACLGKTIDGLTTQDSFGTGCMGAPVHSSGVDNMNQPSANTEKGMTFK